MFQHKICHRDLKLENILLDENCNAKVSLYFTYVNVVSSYSFKLYCILPIIHIFCVKVIVLVIISQTKLIFSLAFSLNYFNHPSNLFPP